MIPSLATTVPAHPLGRPFDGRPRYGMTPVQAVVYRTILDECEAYDPLPFRIMFHVIAEKIGVMSKATPHVEVQRLVERGWLKASEDHGFYEFVQPVMRFARVPDAQALESLREGYRSRRQQPA